MCKQPSGRWDNGNKTHLLSCKVEMLLGNRVLKRLTWSLSAAPADPQARRFLFKFWEFTLDEVKHAVDLSDEKQPAAQHVSSPATVGREKKKEKTRLRNFTACFFFFFFPPHARHSKHSCSKVTYLQCLKKFKALAEMPAARKQVRRDARDRGGSMCHLKLTLSVSDRVGPLLARAKLKTSRLQRRETNLLFFFLSARPRFKVARKCKLPKIFV